MEKNQKNRRNFFFKTMLSLSVLLTSFQVGLSAGTPQDQVVYNDLRSDQVVISLHSFVSNTKIVAVKTTPKETYVTMIVPIYFDAHWVSISKNTILLDRATGDKYYLRSMANDIPIGKVSVIKESKGSMVELTFIFPPLKKRVKRVDFIELPDPSFKKPENGSALWRFNGLPVGRRVESRYTGSGETIR